MDEENQDGVPTITSVGQGVTAGQIGETVIVVGDESDNILDLGLLGPAQRAIVFTGEGGDSVVSSEDITQSWVFGGPGDDVFVSRSPDNAFIGGSGDDLMFTYSGDDYFRGGTGDDNAVFELATAADGSDRLFGGFGNDTLELRFTDAEWRDNGDLRLDVQTYATTLQNQSNLPGFLDLDGYSFSFADLRVRGFENLRVVVDGIEIDPFNQSPVAEDDAAVAGAANPASLLDNDSDPDGDPLTVTAVNGSAANVGVPVMLGSGATLNVQTDGTYNYVPQLGFAGGESFTYTVSDGELTVTVQPTNTPPVAMADAVSGDEDTVIQGNVLTNDSDADADPLTPTLVQGASQGTVVLRDDGSFDYTPDPDFNGVDTFSYQVSDGRETSDTVEVVVTVQPVNDAPEAVADEAVGEQDAVISGQVLSNDSDVDGDSLTAALETQASNGTVVVNPNGTFAYTPDAGFSGVDSFTYRAGDGVLWSKAVPVDVTVVPVNKPPVGVADAVSGDEDTVISGQVLTNDSDPENDVIKAQLETAPANGAVAINPDGTFDYTPNADFNGEDSFTYRVNDGEMVSDPVPVTVTVNPVNDAPVAQDDFITTQPETPVTIPVGDNDSDPDGDPLTVVSASAPNGSVVPNNDGTLTYTPNVGFVGSDAISYTVSDTAGASDDAQVAIEVGGLSQIAIADASVDEDAGSLSFVVTRSGAVDDPVTVEYQTAEIPPGMGFEPASSNDFVADSGVLFFNPGETQKMLDIQVLDDSEIESDESFLVNLSTNSGLTQIDDGTAFGTITDDDGQGGAASALSFLGGLLLFAILQLLDPEDQGMSTPDDAMDMMAGQDPMPSDQMAANDLLDTLLDQLV